MTTGERTKIIKTIANSFDYLEIGPLSISAHVVGLAQFTFQSDLHQRFSMVFHIKPVADIRALTVYRQFLAIQRIQCDQRYQFFRKLAGAVIV